MDVKIKTDDENFKFRVNTLIFKDNKLLLVDINQNGFLCLPGGHVKIGEDTKQAAIRETFEEVGVTSENQKLVAVIENFFHNKKGKKFHELSFYYVMENPTIPQERQKDFYYVENDEGQSVELDFKWISLDKIDDYDIRPKELIQILKQNNFVFSHFIVR